MGKINTDFITNIMKEMIRNSGTKNFFVALHNTFVHGEILEETGEYCTDKQLGQLFEHFDAIISIVKEFE